MRFDGRPANQIRPVKITPHFLKHPAGSCLIEMGGTKVVCSAMLEESVPPFLKGKGTGWLTAEYAMLPASSSTRVGRERAKIGGRTHEIQRLIGRSLRAVADLSVLGERSILIDCDVLDADGGTRTASITGAFVAVALALQELQKGNPTFGRVLKTAVAAISVGIVKGVPVLDLCYEEDKSAEVDMNIVKTAANQYVEVQGTAEGATFGDKALQDLLALAHGGLTQLFEAQRAVLEP